MSYDSLFSRLFKRLNVLAIIPILPFSIIAQTNLIDHQLENLIIRSYDIQNGICLIGLKGEEKGSGKVYYCDTQNWDWQKTNKDVSLDEETEDVQTVAIINDSTFLAGTWKNGLFKTVNRGLSWTKIVDFPAKDIRAIRVCPSNNSLIYASTTTHGFLKSNDAGNSWQLCSPDSLFRYSASWTFEIDPKNEFLIYALSFENGLLRSKDGGESWESILEHVGVMFYDIHISSDDNNKFWLVAAGDSTAFLYETENSGQSWDFLFSSFDIQLNQIALLDENRKELILGSWNKGAFVWHDNKVKHIDEIDFDTISHVAVVGEQIVIFTWGNGVYRISIPN